MKYFFSCDWGTSNFRLRLIGWESAKVFSEIKTDRGVAAMHQLWEESDGKEEERVAFYQAYIFDQLDRMSLPPVDDLESIPIVISGMTSSGLGMYELPYKQLPFRTDGTDLLTKVILSNKSKLPSQLIMISGACSTTDVMRGEETMLIGCDIPSAEQAELFIFPGTHSKHILVKNGLALSVATYMTGELFNLLIQKSILSGSVQKNNLEKESYSSSFREGVIDGQSLNLLNAMFRVRVNYLLNKATVEENYFYLSGLLIGYELKDVVTAKPFSVTMVGGGELKKLYTEAILTLGLESELKLKDADEALVRGQQKILELQEAN